MSDPAIGGFDLLAASIRADATDLRTHLDVVAAKLSDALPGNVRVERDGGLFARDHRVRRVTVQLAGHGYQLEWTGSDLRATVDSRVVPLDQWTEDLAGLLGQQARSEAQTRSAMASLVDGRIPARVYARSGPGITVRDPAVRFGPDSTIQVGAEDSAVLVIDNLVLPALPPGTHTVGESIPAGAGQDVATGEVEGALFFVSTGERPNQRFGGTVDKVLDPQTQLAVGLRVFGEYSMRVADPVALVRTLGLQGNPGDDRITDVLRDVVLKELRSGLARHITEQGWPVVGLAAHMDELESAALEGVREPAAAFGLAVVRFGNFTVTMKEEDEALVTEHHARLAAAGFAGSSAAKEPPPSSASPAAACAACGAGNAPGARFCSNCGTPMALRCPSCGADAAAGARFCAQCGSALRGTAS